MAPEGETQRAFGRCEPAAEPSVFVCAGWSYGLRQFPVQMDLLFPFGPGDQLTSPVSATHTFTPRNLMACDGGTLSIALLALMKTVYLCKKRFLAIVIRIPKREVT